MSILGNIAMRRHNIEVTVLANWVIWVNPWGGRSWVCCRNKV